MNAEKGTDRNESWASDVTSGGVHDANKGDIGKGKKVGLYGAGFLLLGVLIVVVVMYLVGFYAPLEGTEGVGP